MYFIKSIRAITIETRNLIIVTGITMLALFAAVGFTAHAQDCGVGGYQQDGGGGCYDVGGQQSLANVQMTANPAAIQQGANSVLSWGPDNSTDRYPYDTCTIDHGVGTVSNTGSKTVSPAATTDYGITCTHYVQYSVPCGNTNCDASYTETSSASATVTVTPNPTLIASCSVNPTSIATNGSATWSATASGGNGSYTYAWSGTDGLSGSTASVTKSYPTAGTKTGSVTVTSGAQSITQSCGSGLTVTPAVATCGAAIGYLYRYTTVQPGATVNPVTGVQVEGPYAGLANPAENQACTSLGYSRLYDAFEAPVSANKVPGSCYEYYNANGSIYSFDGAGPEKTIYYSVPAGTCPVTQADLTPTALTPHTVIAGQSSTFTATMFNGGTVATPNFSSTIFVCAQGDSACQSSILAENNSSVWSKVLALVYQVAHAASSVNITLTGSPIAANASGPQTGSHTFATPGTYQARLCADLPLNQVAESNEQNNCGNWQVLTVCPSGNTIDGSGNCVVPPPPASPTPTCSLIPNPSSAPSTLTWASTNASSCTSGGFSTGGALNGSVSVGAGNYTFSCTGTGGSCSTSATVTAAPGGTCSGAPVMDITAYPPRVRAGQTSKISWRATNVPGASPSCTVSGPGMTTVNVAAGATPTCAIPNSSATPVINSQSTYTITCAGVSKPVVVNVIPKFVDF